jgi:hypothetical protein
MNACESGACATGFPSLFRGLIAVAFRRWWRTATLGDQVVATAILDRLLHHSHVLTIRGDSYRLREKRRSGLLKATTAPAPSGASG